MNLYELKMKVDIGRKMKHTSNAFEIIDSEETSLKLQKTHLAIKYLDFQSNKVNSTIATLTISEQISLIKSTQSLNALNYTLYFLSEENYELLNESSKLTILKIFVSLLKAINSNNQKSTKTNNEDDANDAQKEWDVLNRLVNVLSIQSIRSDIFCIEFSECTESYGTIFQIIDHFELDENNEPLLENLIKLLLNLSKFHKKYPNIWTKNSNEIIMKINAKIEELDLENIGLEQWYIFLIRENLNNNTDPGADLSQYFDTKISFEENAKDDDKLKLKKRDLSVKYLKYINEPSKIINSSQCMNIIYYLNYFSESIDFRTFENSLQLYFLMFPIDLIKYLYEEIKRELLILEKKKKTKRNMILVDKLTCIILNCSSETLEFCSKFHKVTDSIKILCEFINDEILRKYLVENIQKEYVPTSCRILKDIIENVLCSLHNLSRVSYKYKAKWDEIGTVNLLTNFIENVGHLEENFRVFTYFILSNIASDREIETLKEIKLAIKFITEIIIMCSNSIENNTAFRNKIQVDDEDNELHDIVCCKKSNQTFNLIELTEAVYHLSVNDKLKIEIYESCLMKLYLKKLIYIGNEIEKEFAVKLLYQLSFDDNISKDLAGDEQILTYLNNLFIDENVKRNKLKRGCEGIIFNVRNFLKPDSILLNKNRQRVQTDDQNIKQENTSSVGTATTPSKETKEKKHIMISYNRDSREICTKIKSELEKLNYDVWIDFEDIRGSSLESMALAIEESQCVLMGMTEKYKLSSNCRLEAEYAVNLNKPIIPLILQKDYKPDGWLGIILGSKMFVNFKKYDWDECIKRLMVEVTNIYGQGKNDKPKIENPKQEPVKPKEEEKISVQNHDVTNNQIDTTPSRYFKRLSREKVQKVMSWTEKDLKNWFDEKNFNANLIDNLKPDVNGKVLFQMFQMLQTTPEFFYTALRTDSNNKLFLKDIALFSLELSALFEEEHF